MEKLGLILDFKLNGEPSKDVQNAQDISSSPPKIVKVDEITFTDKELDSADTEDSVLKTRIVNR